MNKCDKCGFLHYRTDPCREPKENRSVRVGPSAAVKPDASGPSDEASGLSYHLAPELKSTAARINARVMVDCVCEACGSKFKAVPHEVKRGKARTCSKPCAARLASRPDQSGENNPNWKGGVPKTKKNKRYVERYPEKHEAHRLMTNAIRRGELARQPCEVCGEPKVDGHHDDYSKPLDVRWLCRIHHIEAHKGGFGLAGTQALPVDTNSPQNHNASGGNSDGGKPLTQTRPAKFDKKAWMREYMREYMRKRRAKNA